MKARKLQKKLLKHSMVNRLVRFGTLLLSEERERSYRETPSRIPAEERLRTVTDADLQNFVLSEQIRLKKIKDTKGKKKAMAKTYQAEKRKAAEDGKANS